MLGVLPLVSKTENLAYRIEHVRDSPGVILHIFCLRPRGSCMRLLKQFHQQICAAPKRRGAERAHHALSLAVALKILLTNITICYLLTH